MFGLDEVEEAVVGVDDDGSRRLAGAEEHLLPLVGAAELVLLGGRHVAGLIDDVHVDLLGGREDAGKERRRDGDRRRGRPRQKSHSHVHVRSVVEVERSGALRLLLTAALVHRSAIARRVVRVDPVRGEGVGIDVR